MSNRNRLFELPELRSSRSLTSSLLGSSSLKRSQATNFRASAGSILPDNSLASRRTPPVAPKLQLSPFARSRPNTTLKSPDALPLSRLSFSTNGPTSEASVSAAEAVYRQPVPQAPIQRSQQELQDYISFPADTSDKLLHHNQPNVVVKPAHVVTVSVSSTHRCLVGLSNLGNTCFMASQLQSLGCLSDIIGYFADSKYAANINKKSPSKGLLVQSFAALMAKLCNGPDGHVVRPSDLKVALGGICRRFSGYAQQDSQEFLRTLLSGIHDDLNEIQEAPSYLEIIEKPEDPDDVVSDRWWTNYTERNRSYISGLFCGQLRSHVICTKCSHRSRTFDPFWDLSLPIKAGIQTASSLEDCFRIFTAEESINDYVCSRCKDHVVAKRKMSIHRFPQILVVHLKRFEFSSVLPRKLDALIKFPLEGLNLSSYASESSRLKPLPIYDLKAVSNHYGSTSGGHYTAMGMISPATWAEFNDSSASKISSSSVCSTAAYVLFFRLRNC